MAETVKRWMTTPLLTARDTAPLDQVAALMIDHGIRHVPVVRADGHCIGITSDLAVFSRGNWLGGRWSQKEPGNISTTMEPVRCLVKPDDPWAEVIATMRAMQSDHALVMGEAELPVGIFTEHDVVAIGAQRLPADFSWQSTSGLVSAEKSVEVREALSRMMTAQVRHLVVTDKGALAGVVSVRDLIARPGEWKLAHAMPFGLVHQIDPGTPLRTCAERMQHLKVGALVEVDGGRPVNIVTRTDVTDALLFFSTDEDTEGMPSNSTNRGWGFPP